MRSIKPIPEYPMLVSEFAKITGVNDRQVRVWIREEGLPVMESKVRGAIQVNGPEGFHWMVNREIKSRGFLDDKKGKVVDIDPQGINGEKLRKTRAERIKLETANRVRHGELLETKDVAESINMAFVLLKNLLDGLAGKMSGGNAVKRKSLLGTFRAVLVQYQNQLRSCFTDVGVVEVTPPTTG